MKKHSGIHAKGLHSLWRILAILLILILLAAAFDSRMIVRRYEIDAEEISAPIEIVLVTDLHSCRYGENQSELIRAVDALSPDIILLGGDIFDDKLPDTNAELFLSAVSKSYPCYYVTGNHEHWSTPVAFAAKMSILQKHDIRIISGECVTLSVNGEFCNLCGVDDPDAHSSDIRSEAFSEQLSRARTASENGLFTLLLSHRPEHLNAYAELGFDLVLCGHAHGGQWRIPWLLNGLFAPDQGLFPQYAGGRYVQDDTTMIVSRGLARESTRIPRIFNRPELLLIRIY